MYFLLSYFWPDFQQRRHQNAFCFCLRRRLQRPLLTSRGQLGGPGVGCNSRYIAMIGISIHNPENNQMASCTGGRGVGIYNIRQKFCSSPGTLRPWSSGCTPEAAAGCLPPPPLYRSCADSTLSLFARES